MRGLNAGGTAKVPTGADPVRVEHDEPVVEGVVEALYFAGVMSRGSRHGYHAPQRSVGGQSTCNIAHTRKYHLTRCRVEPGDRNRSPTGGTQTAVHVIQQSRYAMSAESMEQPHGLDGSIGRLLTVPQPVRDEICGRTVDLNTPGVAAYILPWHGDRDRSPSGP